MLLALLVAAVTARSDGQGAAPAPAQPPAAAQPPAPVQPPAYTPEGRMPYPSGYREWIFLAAPGRTARSSRSRSAAHPSAARSIGAAGFRVAS